MNGEPQRWSPQSGPDAPRAEQVAGALAGIRDLFVQFDTDWRYVFVSESAAALVGRSPSELIGQRVWELFPQGIGNDFHRLALEAMRTQVPVAFEHRSEFAGRWLDTHLYPAPQGLSVFAVDITERKREQVDARQADEARARLAAIVESSDDAVIGKTPAGIVTSWNDGARRIFGYSAEQMIGDSVERLYPDDRVSEESELLARVRAGHRVENFESVRRRADGALIDISITLSPVRAADGAITGVSSVARDVTSRKASERALLKRAREQAALYGFTDALHRAQSLDEVYRAGLDVIVSVLGCERASILLDDGTGFMRFVAWRSLSDGYRRAVEGHSPWKRGERDPQPVIIADVAGAGLAPDLAAVVLGEGIRALAFIPLVLDGQLIGKFMAYYDRACGLADEELNLALTVARQLTFSLRRLQAEESLRESDRRKDEFLATLAHELRNPLAPIRSALELMRLVPDNPAIAGEAREVIGRQAENLVRLVDDLLDISRISRNRLELQRQALDLKDVLRGALETSRPLMVAARHTVEVDLPSTPLRIDGDPVRLAQAFSNLLNNAAKYTEPGGRIQLRAARAGDGVEVRVADSGIGIESAMLPRIFDMFVQGEGAPERSRGGLGVGLSLVRRLVELHGGRVEAHSAGRGSGSEFRVWLPAGAMRAEPAPAAASGPVATTPRRVLVADDNRDAADSLVQVLRLQGHDVRAAYDGQQAVEVADGFAPEVVLMDLGMPRLSGYEAAARIRALRRPVRLVALTGWGQEQDRRRAREAGFDGHFVKPIDLAALREVLAPAPP